MTTLTALSNRGVRASQSSSRTSQAGVAVLSLYAVLRVVLPSQYVIGPLGGAGQPAELLGLGIALWWLADRLGRPGSTASFRQPLKRFALLFVLAVLVSYLVSALRPLSSAEQLAADRGVLNVISWIGVLLAATDGIATRAGLDTLLRRVTLLGALEGILGIVQLMAKQSFLQYFQLPGLSNTGVDPLLLSRGSFLRPVGTAISPIEYGVFLSVVLPVALHYALSDAGQRSLLARWFPVGAIACALSLSLSRSAIISTALGLAVILPTWSPRLRRRMYLAAAVFIAGAAVGLPGFIRTVAGLFGGLGSDSSALSRLNSYSVAWSFITRSPVFGRGAGTFLPEYWILDNEYLGSLIEIGVVGLICMLLLFSNGIVTGWQLRRPMAVPGGQTLTTFRLGPAIASAIAAASVSFAFFDAFSFPMVSSMLFLMLGCVGALHRLTHENAEMYAAHGPTAAAQLESSNPRAGERFGGMTIWSILHAVRRLWPLAAAGLVATFAGSYLAATAAGVYYEQANVIFITPGGSGLDAGDSSVVATAGLVAAQMDEKGPLPLSPTATIVGTGIRHGVWVRLPNEGDQWATNFDQQDLDVEVDGGSASQVQAEAQATVTRIRTLLRSDQLSAGARSDELINVGVTPQHPSIFYLRGSRARATITAFAIGLILTLTSVVSVDGRLLRRGRGRLTV